MSCSKYNPEYWRPLLEQNANGLDVEPLIAWITEESAGCPAALGSATEVGIFQLELADGPNWGGTLATLHGNFSAGATSQRLTRDLTSDEELLQVTSGIAFVQWVRQRVQGNLDGIGQTWSPEDVWCLTKLYHALPRLTDQYLTAGNDAHAAGSWSDFRDYLVNITQSDAAAVNATVARVYWGNKGLPGFTRFVNNAETVGFASTISNVVSEATGPLADDANAGGDDGSIALDLLLIAALVAAAWIVHTL